MTLSRRELLAGMAMQGWLSQHLNVTTPIMTADCVAYADALIAELEKTEKKSDSDLPF